MREFTAMTNVFQNQALTVGAPVSFSKEFPLGEQWLMALLTFEIVIGTGGTTARADGELLFIKNILLKSDKDPIIINCPARGLYYLGMRKAGGQAPYKDNIDTGTGSYFVQIPLFFSNPLLNVPNDTFLDTSRYKSLTLEVTLGATTDLWSSVGSGAITSVNLSCDVMRVKGTPTVKTAFVPYTVAMPPVDPTSQSYVDLERSGSLALLNVLLFSTTSATAGVGFSGVASSAVLDQIMIEDNKEQLFNYRNEEQIRFENMIAGRHSNQTGQYHFNFCSEGSIKNAYKTGDKTRLQVKFTNDTPSTSGITALIDGVKPAL